MPDSLDLVDRLRAEGHAAVVSGAGPTVLVLTVERELDPVTAYAPDGWRPLVLDVATRGVTVRSTDRRDDDRAPPAQGRRGSPIAGVSGHKRSAADATSARRRPPGTKVP